MGERLTRRVRRTAASGRPLRSSPFWVAAGLLALGLSRFAISAPLRCTLEVDVTPEPWTPPTGVEVTVRSSTLFHPRTVVTGTAGRAVFPGLEPGSYRAEVSLPGYQWMEIDDVRCDPGAVIRLNVVLERTAGDEEIIVPSGPSVDPEATTVGLVRSRAALDALPEPMGPDFSSQVGTRTRPFQAEAFEGTIEAGGSESAGPIVVSVGRKADADFRGSVSLDMVEGAAPRTTGTRGEVTGIDGGFRGRTALGGRPVAGKVGAFAAFEGASVDSVDELRVRSGEEDIARRRPWKRREYLGSGVLDGSPSPSHRLDLRVDAMRRSGRDVPSTLHLVPGAEIPDGDLETSRTAVGVGWDAMVSEGAILWVTANRLNARKEWSPGEEGPLEQDQTGEGYFSDGLGNGVWRGAGGLPAFREEERRTEVSGGMEGVAGGGHRLRFDVGWQTGSRDTRYPGLSGDAGIRRYFRDSESERIDRPVPPEKSSGRETVTRFFVEDSWRVTPDFTLVAGLEGRNIEFDAGASRPGYRFTIGDTVSPRLGVVWDFEGEGRSRAWVRWARFREGPGEVVRRRLTGALDVETTFIDGDGSSSVRPPGTLSVSEDLDPSVTDETVFGIEYELLSHLTVGGAGIVRSIRDIPAVLTEDGGRSFVLGTPSGDAWPDTLEQRRVEGRLWLRKRPANGWQAEISVEWARSRGTFDAGGPGAPADLEREYLADVWSPEALAGARGPLPDDRRWRLDFSGAKVFGSGFRVGGRLVYRSGAPVSRRGALSDGLGLDRRFVDSRGDAGRSPDLWRLDVVGSWPVEIGVGRLEFFVEVLNLLNSQRATRLDERWSLLDDDQAEGLDPEAQRTDGTWREPLERIAPLEGRLGLAYRW